MKDSLIEVDPKELPANYTMIYTTTQLKLKRKATDGSPEKYKARTCARGDMIEGMLMQHETYSPTVSPITFATIFQLAIIDNMERACVDTIGAYLYQQYPHETRPIYVKLEKEVAEICNLNPNAIYKMLRYIYGLPDAGRAYYEAYSKHLVENGYSKSKLDLCLFIRVTATETTYIMIHVDDTFICSNSKEGILRLQSVLQSKFDITINDNADSYLGIYLNNLKDGSVQLLQPKLLNTIFEEFPQKGTRRPVTTPMKSTNSNSQSNQQSLPCDRKKYLHLLGALMYLTKSRPDIQTATSFAATKSQNPTEYDYDQLLNIVDYLYNTKEKGLILHRKLQHNNNSNSNNSALDNSLQQLQLKCYVDASYLIHPDSHSHTGYTLSFGDSGCFYSKSMKQQQVSTSSTHAELRALYTLVQDIIYIIDLMSDINRSLQLPAIVFEDNFPVLQLAKSEATGARKCRHFQMLIAYVQEQVNNGLIEARKVHTTKNNADLLSKPIFGDDFHYKSDRIMGYAPNDNYNDEEIPRLKKTKHDST